MKNYEFTEYPFQAERHEAVLPLLNGGSEAKRHAVTIIGGGPVGLTVALGLAKQGVASVLVEADDTVCFGSRAICISRRSLQIIERLGALQNFIEKGLPWTAGKSFYRDVEVLNFTMAHDDDQKLPPMLNIEQFYIEHFLVEEAKKHSDLIDIRWNSEVTKVESNDTGATLQVSTPEGDYSLQTDWLVACDGGRSFVREALGLELKGTTYEGRYVIVDIHLKSSLPTGRLAWFDPPSNPGSSILMHKQPDDVWRVDYQIGEHEDAQEAVKPENVIPRVQSHLDMIGEEGEWSPIWITLYKAHALTLEKYRHGKVLFAGDAAHLLPIFGVRGANSGIDDADNLSWKLAMVVKGVASQGLLDTYSEERVFAAHENLSYGTKSTEFMSPPSHAFELMRRAVLTLAVQEESVRPLINPRQTSAIDYSKSPLAFCKQITAQDDLIADTRIGTALPEFRTKIIEAGHERDGHLSDVVSFNFNLLCFTDDGEVPADIEAVARGLPDGALLFDIVRIALSQPVGVGDPVVLDTEGRIFTAFGAQPGACYLIRPDGYIADRWASCRSQDIRASLKHFVRF